MVAHPSKCDLISSLAILVFGLVTLFFNYQVDRQKELFKAHKGKCFIWGKPAKYLVVVYYTMQEVCP